MADAFIFDHVRTPRGQGKKDGSLHGVTPVQLASQMLRALPGRNAGLDTKQIDDVILGCVTPVGEQGANIARTAVLMAGYDESVPGVQVNRFCASGLEAVNMAAAKVASGQSIAVAGGVESMTRVPMGSDGGAWATDPAVAIPTYFVPQGISADLIATLDGYSRNDVEPTRLKAISGPRSPGRNAALRPPSCPLPTFSAPAPARRDEMMRPDSSTQSLGALKASFADMGKNFGFDGVALQKYPEVERINHVHTPGNSSGIVDGAAAILIGSKRPARRRASAPARASERRLHRLRAHHHADRPELRRRAALAKPAWSKGDIDLWELNEAFAAVVLRFMGVLDIPHDKINVCGGAIAMGHPLGATGAMILGILLDEMERRGLARALPRCASAQGWARQRLSSGF